MVQKSGNDDQRTRAQIRTHYEIEKELATRLRQASPQQRRTLYASLYNELYQRVPHHQQLTQKFSPEKTRTIVARRMRFLKHFLHKDSTFLEIGPGDCALAFEVAKFATRVYAVDVSNEITQNVTCPPNFQLILSDGYSIPVPAQSVNLAYSNQLIEHLHPDDAFEQLQNIYHALIPGGKYICITCNQLSGPHDISKYFDPVATGFHLKEYTLTELSEIFKKVGFVNLRNFVGGQGYYANAPISPLLLLEKLLNSTSSPLKRSIARSFPVKQMLTLRLMGTK